MNDLARRIVQDRMRGRRDFMDDENDYTRDEAYHENDRERDNRRDRERDSRRGDRERDMERGDGRRDSRRGVRGSGRRDNAGWDGHSPVYLSKQDLHDWKRMLLNSDGSSGPHFKDADKILAVADKLGIRFNEYTEKELCMATNLCYSDFCDALKSVIPTDQELYIYVKMGRAFLEDEDGPEASEKLAMYFYTIVEHD